MQLKVILLALSLSLGCVACLDPADGPTDPSSQEPQPGDEVYVPRGDDQTQTGDLDDQDEDGPVGLPAPGTEEPTTRPGDQTDGHLHGRFKVPGMPGMPGDTTTGTHQTSSDPR